VRHRRPRKPLLSPSSLLGTALGASLMAGIALGTAAAAADNSHRSGAITVNAPTTGPSRAKAGSAPSDAKAATGSSDTDVAPGDAEAGLAPGGVLPARTVLVGVPEGVAKRLKPRPKPDVTAQAAPAWANPNPTAVVTSCFGPRWGRLHAGVDLAAPDGTPIVAAGAGVVVRAGVAEGYGNAVLIDHGNGYLTHYGHLSAITVTVGRHVAPGQQIGNEGSTGHSTGPHLHFEVHQGYYKNPVEPIAWMHAHGVDIPGCSSSSN
jgi:murein DD-endopeptidase MepM/ murein hydrolase activator NlpD